ncbi:hypothetical protein BDY19DRAFT_992492 [Irpex rosettiformis]|uniref:Uncharacterized protein n=1 Tax=Irpex rosettiformis TaxID=378272 RepID=A0ACB8U828_9APHY|nr:hypothetical protein BDY19DRAFT_992492 [Irpex rosettiformis]
MSAETTTLDGSPIRVWRATEKRLKNLKRWTSMPLKQVAPPNRPLFKCSTCGFVNTRGELCLQCTRAGCVRMIIQNGSVKRRRVSAPQPLNDAQKEQLLRIQQQSTSTLYKPTQEQVSQSVAGFGLYPPETKTIRRKRHRDAAVLSIRDVAAAAHLSPEANFYVRSIIVARSQHEEVTPPSSTVVPESGEPNTTELEDQKASVGTPTLSPQRTLRRKKRFTLSRQRSIGASLRSRTGFRLPTFAINEPVPHTPVNSPAPSQPNCTAPTPLSSMEHVFGAVPLGHPTRPFYTAIRKLSPYTPPVTDINSIFSRAGSPGSEEAMVSHPRARSLDLQPSMDFGEGEDRISRYFSRPYAVDLSSGAATGCSVSGEIELRMALARRNTIGGSAAHPEYRFEYPQTTTSPETQKRGSGVKLRVKKIGQGLRNLMLAKKPTSPVLA